MRKLIVFSLVLAICLLGVTQLAFAAEAAVSPGGSQRACFLDLLDEDTRAKVEEVIQEYYEKMIALRERMQQSRVDGDRDDLMEARKEIWDLKEERRESIAEVLPEELQDDYLSRGFEKQQRHRPSDRSFGHGWEKSGRMLRVENQVQKAL